MAGGALLGVIVALGRVNGSAAEFLDAKLNAEPALEHALGRSGYELLGVIFFAALGYLLFRASRKPQAPVD